MLPVRDFKLGTKQLIGFGILLAIMAGLNLYHINRMQAIQEEIDEVSHNWLPRAVAISDINRSISDLRIQQLQHAFAGDEAVKMEQAQVMIGLIDKINANLDTYEMLKKESEERGVYSDEERKLYETFDAEWETYQDLSFTFFGLTREGENKLAVMLLNGEAKELYDSFSQHLEDLVEVTKHDSNEAAARAEETFVTTRRTARLLMIATIILSLFLVFGMVRLIVVPIQQLERVAGEISRGNLDVRLNLQRRDEIGSLAKSFNHMAASLQDAQAKMENQAAKLRERNEELARAMDELKSSQEQLLLREKMASLGHLVAGVAHEINNPIGTVNSAADVSKRCLERIEKALSGRKRNGQLPKTLRILRENISITRDAGLRISTIVKSLKSFARLDAAEYQLGSIHDGLDSSLTLLNSELQGRVEIDRQYGDVPDIVCSHGQLNQVFLNLLKNASSAIGDKGKITIKTWHEKGTIHIEIADTGSGIPAAKLDTIFDFGFSAGGSRVKFTSGLSTAYSIIQKHNGDIRVTSEAGVGATFHITLPVSDTIALARST